MAPLFQKFQEAVKVLERSPTFANNGRQLQFEADICRPFKDLIFILNGSSTPNPDTKIRREAERICKIVSERGNFRNLGSSLDNAKFSDMSLSPVLKVLYKRNNSGTMALHFSGGLRSRKVSSTLRIATALIESLGRIKQFHLRVNEAIEKFERMEKMYGWEPDLRLCNRLLDTLRKSRHVEKAQELFDIWKNWKFVPDIKSYAVVLRKGG